MKRIGRWVGLLLYGMVPAGCQGQATLEVTVSNPSAYERPGEIVEVGWKQLENVVGVAEPGKLVVHDAKHNEMPSQVIYGGSQQPVALIFQVTVPAGGQETFSIRQGQPAGYRPMVYGRLVPERMDDFAWENRIVAYRVYGPALEATGEISNGIDIWCKSTDRLVLDEWYKNGDYHRNHGEGMDAYKVGRTLGGGAMAPLYDGRLALGNNFVKYRILDQGPLRISFVLDYAPFQVGEWQVTEQREITLDADSRFCRIREKYSGYPDTMEVAAGIVLREQPGERLCESRQGIMGYWEPKNRDNGEDNGYIGVGVFFPHALKRIDEKEGHLLAVTDYPDEPVEYYMGSAWSLAGVKDAATWFGIIAREKDKLDHPLQVLVGK